MKNECVRLEGYPESAYDGLYFYDSMYEGWPVLKNAKAPWYCYRYASTEWRITQEFAPSENKCAAFITAKSGLPVGTRTWKVGASAWPKGTKPQTWNDHPLTVSIMVSTYCVCDLSHRAEPG